MLVRHGEFSHGLFCGAKNKSASKQNKKWSIFSNLETDKKQFSKTGISLITLVITIIVIIILAAIVLYTSLTTVDNANYATFVSEYDEINMGTQAALKNNVLNGNSEEERNAGFTKVKIENAPDSFESVSDGAMEGYLIDLDTIKVTGTKTGKAEIINDTVTFEKDDVYVYDDDGKVYYAKGYNDAEGNLTYRLDEYEDVSPTVKPTIGNVDVVVSSDKTYATVKVTATAGGSGELTVTVDGKTASKTGANTYEVTIDKNGTVLVTVSEAGGGVIRQNVTITGIEKVVETTYTVTLNPGYTGGSKQKITKAKGESITLPTLSRDGYDFLGWATTENATSAEHTGSYTVNGTIDLYGVWQRITYTVTLNPGYTGGSEQKITKAKGESITLPTLSRNGYDFLGWATQENATSATYEGSYTEDKAATLYAVWKSRSLSILLEVSDGYTYGETFSKLNVKGNTGNGTVTYYYYGESEMKSNKKQWTTEIGKKLNAGSYYIYAAVAATTNYDGAETEAVKFTVSKASGSISFIIENETKTYGDASFTVAANKTGDESVSLNYSSSNKDVATVDSTGKVTIVGAGETIITATVTSETNYTYTPNTATYTLTVNRANITTIPTVSMSSYTYGGTMTPPSITGYTGTVTYYYNTSDSNKGGTEWKSMTSRSLNARDYYYYMYAVIPETTNYNEARTATVKFTVGKASGRVSFDEENITKTYGDESFTVEANNDGDGTVTYSSSNKDVATVDSTGRVTIVETGTATITATVADGTNYKYTAPNNTASYTLEVEASKFYLMNGRNEGHTEVIEVGGDIGTIIQEVYSSEYVLGYNRVENGTTYYSNRIKTITFQRTKAAPETYINAADSDKTTWDVSLSGDGTIMVYLVKNSESTDSTTYYDLYIGANLGKDGKIILPENSERLFAEYSNCVSIAGLEVLDTSQVKNMSSMFSWCEVLTDLNLSSFNTANVINMAKMFYRSYGLTSLDLSSFDTSNVTDMSNMFYFDNLTSLNLSSFNTSNVTDMSNMFDRCNCLTSLDLSNFDTSQVTDMSFMFNCCSSLTSLDVSNFDTSSVTDMYDMFYGCDRLKTIITTATKPIALYEYTHLDDECILYVLNEEVERDFEIAENYETIFGDYSKDTIRDDGTKDLARIRSLIELVGDCEVYLKIDGTYNEQGTTVAGMEQNESGDYTPFGFTVSTYIKDNEGNIVTSLDTSKVGTYTITYKLADKSGDTEVSIERVIKVSRSTTIYSVANGPVLDTTQMKAVYWDPNGTEHTTNSFVLAETDNGPIYNGTLYNYYQYDFDNEIYDNKTDPYDADWAKQPRWANAKTEDGSYWVWIPRYAYKITYYEDENRTIKSNDKQLYGYIDVIFLKGTSDDEYIDENGVTQTLPSGYKVHPAFQALTTREIASGDNPLGKWDEELTGIWVAKYEASQEVLEDSGESWSPSEASYGGGNILTTNAGNTDSTKVRVVSKPSVKSWRSINISKIYSNCLNMNPSLNTHQMKNSEWGAVAYLTYSVYGRNGNELSVNQCGDWDEYNFITGAGVGIETENIATSTNKIYGSEYTYDSTTFESTYSWKTEPGKLTSTTGNVYGVYDMSGGAIEYTASYLYNSASTSDNLHTYGSNLVNAPLKYKQIYTLINGSSSTSGRETYAKNPGVYGDAVYETSTSYGSSSGSWCGEYSRFPYAEEPFFGRGGYYGGTSRAGIFNFAAREVYYGSNYGFRPVICITSS